MPSKRPAAKPPPPHEQRFIARMLRDETVGGVLLVIATVVAVVWASSRWADGYEHLQEFTVGPEALHLHLTLETWASDGLLAIFFFVAGLELKRELVVGQLRKPSEAALPMIAAVCGMVVPALVYVALTVTDPEAVRGWAVPIATDIAFALAVLAVLGSALPSALRVFLLTLAIVDDLGAILVIAVGFTDDLELLALAAAAVVLAAYVVMQRTRFTPWWLGVPLSLVLWALVHQSGVHATVAGVALGLATRVRPDRGEGASPAERLEHTVRPLSAGVAVPVFALFAAGVAVTPSALDAAVHDRAALAVVAGLVVGKFVGVLGGTWLAVRLTRAELSPELNWPDLAGVGFLAGIGFTVSLLLADLTFGGERLDHVKVAVLGASVISAALAGVVLRVRTRRHRDASTGGLRGD